MKRYLVSTLLFCLAIACGGDLSEIQTVPPKWEYSISGPDEGIEASRKEYLPIEEKDLGALQALIPGGKGYLWLRNRFLLEKAFALEKTMGLSIGRLAWSDETYVNGYPIGKSCEFPPRAWSCWNTIREYNFPSSLLKKGENEILIKLYADGEGFLYEDTLIGYKQDLAGYLLPKKFINTYVNALVSFLFLIVSGYHYLIYVKRKKDKENYYYAVFALLYALYCTNFFSEFFPHFLTMSYLNHQKIVILIQAGMVYYLARFFSVFFRIHISPLTKYIYLSTLGLSVLSSFLIMEYKTLHAYRGMISLLQFLPALVFLVYSITKGLRDKNPSAKAMVYGMIPLVFVVIHDTSLVVFGLQGKIFLAGLGLPLFLGSIMFVLASKFVAVQNETDELNATLETKVKERTREVTQKMEEIQALKIQQDGDYFLTSLIEKPLNTNYNKSKLVTTSIFLKQKKKFSFRNKNSELGGDLCITGNLRFGDGKDRWVVAFNADAMGKSMQGAGGAIVAGTAMNNIIGRSARNNLILQIKPQEWIEETYKELDSIFQTFNGSMLISCVLSLINERTGEMYYFNAEHPWTAVYRDGKASFIEHELSLRKLGSESEYPFEVKKYKLLSGDVLFMGSDGRDDINLGGAGERVLNEDENLFLRLIEEARADLHSLAELIEFQGELTDDLSLIRIGFQEEFNPIDMEEEIEEYSLEAAKRELSLGNRNKSRYILEKLWEESRENIPALKLLVRILFEDKKYGDSIDRIHEFHKLHPDTELFWFEKSVCHKQLQEYESARNAGEVCRKFQPNRVANLINLADSYRMLGDVESAREVLREALRIEPKNEAALKLASILAIGR